MLSAVVAAAAADGNKDPAGSSKPKANRQHTKQERQAKDQQLSAAKLKGPRRRRAESVGDDGDATSAPVERKARRGRVVQAEDIVASGDHSSRDEVSSLAALFADALSPGSSTAAQQPKKRVRRRKAATPADAGTVPGIRPDPWARYAGMFAVAAEQRRAAQPGSGAAPGHKGPSGPGTTASSGLGGPPAGQQTQQQQQPKTSGRVVLNANERARALFGGTLATGRMSVRRLPTGAPLVPAQPVSAKAAAQRLASKLLNGSAPQRQSLQQRVYVPEVSSPPVVAAPGVEEESAWARREARAEAMRRMRVRTIREYDDLLARTLEWQAQSRQYYFEAPSHLPVALQRTWSAPPSSQQPATVGWLREQQRGSEGVGPARYLEGADQLALSALSSEVQRALGVTLPERALRGERGALLASLSSKRTAATLSEWVGVCGDDYVRQLVAVEPCLLGVAPSELLTTLEALNQHMGLEPSDAVAYLLRHPALVGLKPSELKQRLEGLALAVGLAPGEAQKMVLARPELLMLTPDALEERMAVIGHLLPGVNANLPSMVARRSLLLARSPRALARDIQQLAGTLGLTGWAAGRLVAGGPGILEHSVVTLAKRLQRLKELCSHHRSWRHQLAAMSPAGLGRTLRCNDATFERLTALSAAGLAGSRRLPKVKRILTMPVGRFDAVLEQLTAAKEQAQARRRAAAAVAAGAAGGVAATSFEPSEVDGGDGEGAPDGEDSDDDEDSGMLWAPEDMSARSLSSSSSSEDRGPHSSTAVPTGDGAEDMPVSYAGFSPTANSNPSPSLSVT